MGKNVLEELRQIMEAPASVMPVSSKASTDYPTPEDMRKMTRMIAKSDSFKGLVREIASALEGRLPDDELMAKEYEQWAGDVAYQLVGEITARVAHSLMMGRNEEFEGFEIRDDGQDGARFLKYLKALKEEGEGNEDEEPRTESRRRPRRGGNRFVDTAQELVENDNVDL